MHFVYILKSLNYTKTYTGISTNIHKRLQEHNLGKNKFTKKYRPWKILFSKEVGTRLEARKKEKYLKSSAGRRWIKLNFFSKLNKY